MLPGTPFSWLDAPRESYEPLRAAPQRRASPPRRDGRSSLFELPARSIDDGGYHGRAEQATAHARVEACLERAASGPGFQGLPEASRGFHGLPEASRGFHGSHHGFQSSTGLTECAVTSTECAVLSADDAVLSADGAVMSSYGAVLSAASAGLTKGKPSLTPASETPTMARLHPRDYERLHTPPTGLSPPPLDAEVDAALKRLEARLRSSQLATYHDDDER